MIGRATLALVLLSALPFGSNRPMWWMLLALAVFILFALQLLRDTRTGLDRIALRALAPGSLFLLVIAWSLVQALWVVDDTLAHPAWRFVSSSSSHVSADPIAGLHHAMRLSAYAMVFWIAMRNSTNARLAESHLTWIAVSISLLSAYGIFATLTSNNLLLGNFASGSVSASFINRNNYATFAIIGLVANLALFLRAGASASPDRSSELRDFLEGFFEKNWLFAFGLLICLAGILLSESRAGLASALLGIAVYFLADRKSGKNYKLVSTLMVGALFSFSLLALSSGVFARLFAQSGEDARFLIYPLVIDGIAERPLLGHGLGAFHDAFRIYVPPELARLEVDLAHSSYLENAFELGLPAASIFYGVLLAITLVILRGSRVRRRNRSFPQFALAVTVACGFHALFDFSMQIPAVAALFAFVLGIGWAQAFPHSERNGVRTKTKAGT